MKHQLPPIEELELLIQNPSIPWEMFAGARILIYGGTGFVGTWLTTTFITANSLLKLDLKVSVVTRDIKRAAEKFGPEHSKHINYIEHDFFRSKLRTDLRADYIYHGATPTRIATGSNNYSEVSDAAVNAAIHASNCRGFSLPETRVIHLSSGAIYGPQDMNLSHRSETDPAGSNLDTYGKTKKNVDTLLRAAYDQGKIRLQSPRLFAFAGPLLQLNAHFAIGNFLLDGLLGNPIKVSGNPNTTRSYMYPSDLILSILLIGTIDKFLKINIGSDIPISMTSLSNLVQEKTGSPQIIFTNPDSQPSNYVPSIIQLRELIPNFKPIEIEESLDKWISWIKINDVLAKEGLAP